MKVTELQKNALRKIRDSQPVSVIELSHLLGKHRHTARYYIALLIRKGLIEYGKGSRPTRRQIILSRKGEEILDKGIDIV